MKLFSYEIHGMIELDVEDSNEANDLLGEMAVDEILVNSKQAYLDADTVEEY